MSKQTKNAENTTADVKAIHNRLKEIITGEIEKLPALLEKLPPSERVKTIIELLPYCAPKLEKVSADFAEGWNAWN